MTRVTVHSVAGPAGALQVVEEQPGQEVAAVAVICHPHPLHGGSLTNKVVHQLARTFSELGAVSVRFNFRGVGESEGVFDEGRGEFEDLLAVVEWGRQRWPGRRLWLAGFSFGGFIAIKAAEQLAPDWLVTAAPAITYFPDEISPSLEVPWLLIQGDEDDVVPAAEVLQWLDRLEQPPRLALLKGAGHFFHGRLNDVKRLIIEASAEA